MARISITAANLIAAGTKPQVVLREKVAFRVLVRADGGHTATGITNDAVGNFIIDQYYGQNLTAADVNAAYSNG